MKMLVSIICAIALASSLLVTEHAQAIELGHVVAVEEDSLLVQIDAKPSSEKGEPQLDTLESNRDTTTKETTISWSGESKETSETITAQPENSSVTSSISNEVIILTEMELPSESFDSESVIPLLESEESSGSDEHNPVVDGMISVDVNDSTILVESENELSHGTILDVKEGSIVVLQCGSHNGENNHHEEHVPQEERNGRRYRRTYEVE